MTAAVRVAIAGTGGIARIHPETLPELNGRAQVVAAVDIDGGRARSFAHRHGITHAGTGPARAIAATGPDLVHVCTPPGAHAELARAAGPAGFGTVFPHRFGSRARGLRAPLDAGVRVAVAWTAGAHGVAGGHRARFDEVLRALRGGAPRPVTVAEARRALSPVAGICAPSFTGHTVRPAGLAPGSPFYDRMRGSGPPWEAA